MVISCAAKPTAANTAARNCTRTHNGAAFVPIFLSSLVRSLSRSGLLFLAFRFLALRSHGPGAKPGHVDASSSLSSLPNLLRNTEYIRCSISLCAFCRPYLAVRLVDAALRKAQKPRCQEDPQNSSRLTYFQRPPQKPPSDTRSFFPSRRSGFLSSGSLPLGGPAHTKKKRLTQNTTVVRPGHGHG